MEKEILNITVEYLGYIKKKLGLEKSEEIHVNNNASVHDLFIILANKYGETFKKSVYNPKDIELKPYHMVSVNGLLLNQLNGMKTKLNDNDRIIIMPIVSGG
jgi:MoaD family protein